MEPDDRTTEPPPDDLPIDGTPRRRSLNRVVACSCAVLLALLWGAVAAYLHTERTRTLDHARVNATNLTQAVGQHVTAVMGTIDRLLLQLKRSYEKDPLGFGLDANLRETLAIEGMVIQTAIVDVNGYVVASTMPVAKPVFVGDRAHIRAHIAADTGAMFIGQPVVGRVSGQWSVNVSRRLNRPDGSYGGAAVVAFDPEYLQNFFRSLDLGQQGSVIVVGQDLIVRAASNHEVGPKIGRSLATSRNISALTRAPVGMYEVESTLDGVDRIVSYRTLADYPLVVLTGLARDEVLADFYQTRVWLVAAAIFHSVLFVGVAALLIQRIGAERRIGKHLAQANRRFTQIIDALPLAFVTLAPDRRVTSWNPIAERMFGYTEPEVLGQPYPLVPPGGQTEFNRIFREAAQGTLTQGAETQRRRKDGTLTDVHVFGGVVRDAAHVVREGFIVNPAVG